MIFEHRLNLLLQKSALKFQVKFGQGTNPIDIWNELQPFFLKKLSIAFAEYFCVNEFCNFLVNDLDKSQNEDTKECLQLLYQLFCLDKI